MYFTKLEAIVQNNSDSKNVTLKNDTGRNQLSRNKVTNFFQNLGLSCVKLSLIWLAKQD